tara:strand:- start:5927 stop:6517 length:591 start_codon:yes stop_codon:yes gene_type:complete
MFTGIIESLGKVVNIKKNNKNFDIKINSEISSKLKVDQSLSHNGICLTVVNVKGDTHTVTAINETISKTNLNELKIGDKINLERAVKVGDRLDGHIVQGHVDETAYCTGVTEEDGSWIFTFKYSNLSKNITIEKGSITINGVSLTVINSENYNFSVAIIPYTYENTNFKSLKEESLVNLEFDMIGKYINKLHSKLI